MNMTYKLQRDVVSRRATMLAWNLNSLHSAVRIVHNENVVNGKSLIGILNTYMRAGETITVVVDELEDVDNVKEIFDEFAVLV